MVSRYLVITSPRLCPPFVRVGHMTSTMYTQVHTGTHRFALSNKQSSCFNLLSVLIPFCYLQKNDVTHPLQRHWQLKQTLNIEHLHIEHLHIEHLNIEH